MFAIAPSLIKPRAALRPAFLALSVAALAACEPVDLRGLDFDLRGNAPGGLDTSGAAREATTAARPQPDRNGLITYPTYQVAVARRGDTLGDLADRVGANPTEVARFNGRGIGDALRAGEVIAMPRRTAPPSAAVDPADRPDIGAIAGAAIERSTLPVNGEARRIDVQTGQEPIRHRAARGETAFSIARLYGVTVKSLAEWNGLSSDLEVREGQYLIIPLIIEEASAGGTPVPPSASSSLPAPVVEATLPDSPNLETTRVASAQPDATPARSGPPPGRFAQPVPGTIGAYSSAKQGLDIAASSGTAVTAAADGEVILITRDTDQNPVIVVSHSGDLKSVYANIAGLTVEKGDTVRAGERIAQVGAASSGLRFSILKGFEPVDPTPLLQ